MELAQNIARSLLEIKAVTLRTDPPYTWASGIKAPIYCDNRLLMSYKEKRHMVRDGFASIIKEHGLQFDIVAGVATSGIPHAAWLADILDLPMIYARSKPKDHGKENLVEGKLEKGQKVLVIEDLISTGGSSLQAIEGIRQAGGIVDDCLAIFTYQMEKSKTAFEDANVNLYTLSNFSTLVEVATESGYIKPEEKENVLEWSKSPETWGV